MQQVAQRVLRLFVSGSLFAMIVLLTFNVGTTNAKACSSSEIAAGTTFCTTSISTIQSTSGTLTYSADPAITYNNLNGPLPPPAGSIYGTLKHVNGGSYTYPLSANAEIFGISFGTKVFEGRVSTAGWSIEASTDINYGTIALTSSAPTCTSNPDGTTPCFPLDTDLTTATPTLTAEALPFVTAPALPTDSTNLNVGNYTIATTGTLTLPYNLPPSTNVTGNIIITLASL